MKNCRETTEKAIFEHTNPSQFRKKIRKLQGQKLKAILALCKCDDKNLFLSSAYFCCLRNADASGKNTDANKNNRPPEKFFAPLIVIFAPLIINFAVAIVNAAHHIINGAVVIINRAPFIINSAHRIIIRNRAKVIHAPFKVFANRAKVNRAVVKVFANGAKVKFSSASLTRLPALARHIAASVHGAVSYFKLIIGRFNVLFTRFSNKPFG